MGGVKAEQPVPERGDADALDVVVAGRPHDRVQARDDRLQERGRIVLDAAVGRRGRGVRDLMEPALDRVAAGS